MIGMDTHDETEQRQSDWERRFDRALELQKKILGDKQSFSREETERAIKQIIELLA